MSTPHHARDGLQTTKPSLTFEQAEHEALMNGFSDEDALEYARGMVANVEHLVTPPHDDFVLQSQDFDSVFDQFVDSDHCDSDVGGTSIYTQTGQASSTDLPQSAHTYPDLDPVLTSMSYNQGPALIDTRSLFTGSGERRFAAQNLAIPNLTYVTPSPTSTPTTKALTPAYQHRGAAAQDATVSANDALGALPDTYAGRRGLKARENFPRECAECHRRFLHEASALKHWAIWHTGQPNIIERYKAPKRPPRGQPRGQLRGNRPAKSQSRSSSPVAQSIRDDTPPTTNPPVTPLLTVGQTMPDGDHGVVPMLSHNGPTQVFHPLPSHSTINKQQPQLQPGLDMNSLDPALFQDTDQILQNSISSHLQDLTTPGYQMTFKNQQPLTPLETPGTSSNQETMTTSHSFTRTDLEAARQAILAINPRLSNRQLRKVVASPSVAPNVLILRAQVAANEIQEPLPPTGMYSEQDASLTWHAGFKKYYKHVEGVWKYWDRIQYAWLS